MNQTKTMNLALFDFDGTITNKDSLIEFIKFSVGDINYYLGLIKLSPMLTLYTLKLISNHKAKEKLISYFFKGWDYEKFSKLAMDYSLNEIDTIIRPKALNKINWHKEQGDDIVLVSASMELWLLGWCKKMDLNLIATQLEVKNGLITGNFSSKNCYGKEKVTRLKQVYDLSKYTKVYAYGDSSGDKDLLSIADESYYKPFH